MYIGTVGRRRRLSCLCCLTTYENFSIKFLLGFCFCLLLIIVPIRNNSFCCYCWCYSYCCCCCCCYFCMHCCCLRRAAFSLHISAQRTQLQKSINCNEVREKRRNSKMNTSAQRRPKNTLAHTLIHKHTRINTYTHRRTQRTKRASVDCGMSVC